MRYFSLDSVKIFAFSAIALAGCKEDDNNDTSSQLTIPATYISDNFLANASEEIDIANQLEAFGNAQKTADGGNAVDINYLQSFWNNTRLKEVTLDSYSDLIDNELPRLATASTSGTFDWSTAPNNNGGHYDTRVFNSTGIESVQLVEKGLFNAALFYMAQERIDELGVAITAADIDGLVALFGTNPSFPNSDMVDENADRLQAKYAARRTPSTGGLYLDIKQHFIEARTYATAGTAYNAQKMMALEQVMYAWEKSVAATLINYLYSATDKLSQTNPSDADIASGMHAYSEVVGFLSGLAANPEYYRALSTAQANEMLASLNAPAFEESTAYLLVQNPGGELADVQSVINDLQEVYQFSNKEMESFKLNHVSVENR